MVTAEAAQIGLYSTWLPLRCVSTVSLTIVVWGVQLPFRAGTDLLAVGELQLRLLRDHDSSEIPKCYTGTRDTTFARVGK